MLEICFALAILIPFLTFSGFHQIPEGHVGIYFRGGAILDGYEEPGLHFMTPFLTSVEAVQVTLQTDKVSDVTCGTSGGVTVIFE